MRTGKAVLGPGALSAVLKEGNPLGLHFVMFMPAIMSQGNSEQVCNYQYIIVKHFDIKLI